MKLRFDSVEEVEKYARELAEADKAGKVNMLKKWSLGQNFEHLAKSYVMSVEGAKKMAPMVMRMGAKLPRKLLLGKGIPSGLPINQKMADLKPEDVSAEEGLAYLLSAIEKYRQTKELKAHPIFGELSEEEWNAFHCRHAELHLGNAEMK